MDSSSSSSITDPSSPQKQPVLSVAKALTKLLAVSSNRSCADCRATLVDSSRVFVSMSLCCRRSPDADASNGATSETSANHRRPSLQKLPRSRHLEESMIHEPLSDPVMKATERVGGHAVFVCSRCAQAHELLGSDFAIVHPVKDVSVWTHDEIVNLVTSGGNARSWKVLEAYLPPSWEHKRPNVDSNLGDRILFVRAKYEALAFTLPPPGPLAREAWKKIIRRHPEWDSFWGDDGSSIPADIDVGYASKYDMIQSVMNPAAAKRELPDRLVDFFCVVSCSEHVEPAMIHEEFLKVTMGPEDVSLLPCVTDCYPEPDAHHDLEFPEHLPMFLFPDGCRGSSTAQAPSFFTFVLTTASGDRLYGGALRVYDDDRDIDFYQDALDNSGYTGLVPKWLRENDPMQTSRHSGGYSDVVFLPQCLVVLSHYPFYDTWRKFLLQLYRIALVEAPLPIERFIANFVSEVPLPPPGRIQVKVGFTVQDMWMIYRPPDNELPLANFSFKPLFASLSVSNVMIVFACLLMEMKVALCSRCYSILCPVAEALSSLLFPFHWEGLYLPILPYSMLDILEAPVPFLVGLHSRYLAQVRPRDRPRGVVFVDLDSDVVHLGFEEDGGQSRVIPSLPERPAAKLKAKLIEFASSVYVRPASAASSSITTGAGQHPPLSQRPSYTGYDRTKAAKTKTRRKDMLSLAEKAYRESDLQVPWSGFVTDHGQLYSQEATPASLQKRPFSARLPRKRLTRTKSHESLEVMGHENKSETDEGLLDLDEPESFSVQEIREAFLRFFVALLQNYKSYISQTGFLASDFVQSLGLGGSSAQFCESMVKTQLFQRFLGEREEVNDPEVRFFDESINAKINRSKKTSLMNFGRVDTKETTFLDDTSRMIKETFSPPPPSNWGLPDDGRSYSYGKFPKLNPSLFGKTRPPRRWQSNRRQTRRASIYQHQTEQGRLFHTGGTGKLWRSVNRQFPRSLETALGVLVKASDSSPKMSTQGTYSLDRSLHSYFKTATRALSDLADPIELGRTEKNTDIVSSAQRLVLDARRKQSILIGIFSELQLHRKLARRGLDRDGCHSSMEILGLLAVSSTKRLRLSSFDAASLIQAFFRGAYARNIWIKAKFVVKWTQEKRRARTARWIRKQLNGTVKTLQARARGFIVRKRLRALIKGRLAVYREHLFTLWQCDHTPLTYRSNFWFVIQFDGFLQLGMAEDEIRRLWDLLNILPSEKHGEVSKELSFGDSTLHLSKRLSVKDQVYQRVIELGGMIRTGLTKSDTARLKSSTSREAAERAEIYERLSAVSSSDRLAGYFRRFSIKIKTKKKMELAALIWTKLDQADLSAAIMLELFPELRHTTNIIFSESAKKGSRLFRRNQNLPKQLEESMWAHTFLSSRIHNHVYEVADLTLRVVPRLSAQLSVLDWRAGEAIQADRRRQEAALMARGLSQDQWQAHMLQLMRVLVHGPDVVPYRAGGPTRSMGRRHTLGPTTVVQNHVIADPPRVKHLIVRSKGVSTLDPPRVGNVVGIRSKVSQHSASDDFDLELKLDSQTWIV